MSRGDLLARAQSRQRDVDALGRQTSQLGQRVLLERLGDPSDDVLSVPHLRVLDGLLIDQVTPLEVHEVDDDLGRADVDGGSVGFHACALWLDVDQASLVHRGGGGEPSLAQHRGKPAQYRERHSGGAQFVPHPLAIAPRVVEGGARQRDSLLAHGRPGLAMGESRGREDLPATRGLAHLDADPGGERSGLTGQSPAFGALLRRHLAQFGTRRLAELAGTETHQALATGPTAGTVDGQVYGGVGYRGQECVASGDFDGHADGFYEDLVHDWAPFLPCHGLRCASHGPCRRRRMPLARPLGISRVRLNSQLHAAPSSPVASSISGRTAGPLGSALCRANSSPAPSSAHLDKQSSLDQFPAPMRILPVTGLFFRPATISSGQSFCREVVSHRRDGSDTEMDFCTASLEGGTTWLDLGRKPSASA